jgi:hypothetical protein
MFLKSGPRLAISQCVKTKGLEKTLPLSEQIVGDAWRSFVASSPPLISVPAFLSWLGHNEHGVLQLVNETALVRIATRLFRDGEQAPPLPSTRRVDSLRGREP